MRAIVLASILSALAGCRTRPEDWSDTGAPFAPAGDSTRFDAAPSDLRPPADLALPEVCRNVWVVDQDGVLSAFDTNALRFIDVGTLKCPTSTSDATPQSMAVARDATAYVYFDDGELFRVDTKTAACSHTPFVPHQRGFQDRVGMGFVADEIGGSTETLYIINNATLARIAFPRFVVEPVALLPITAFGELTGTADAQLWAFFPLGDQSLVARLNERTATLETMYSLPSLSGSTSGWAFAFWGGSFWIFLGRGIDGRTDVYRLERSTGRLSTVLTNTGRLIVGAGTSTCAPL